MFNINVKVENEENFPKSQRKAQCTLIRQWAGLSRTMTAQLQAFRQRPNLRSAYLSFSSTFAYILRFVIWNSFHCTHRFVFVKLNNQLILKQSINQWNHHLPISAPFPKMFLKIKDNHKEIRNRSSPPSLSALRLSKFSNLSLPPFSHSHVAALCFQNICMDYPTFHFC